VLGNDPDQFRAWDVTTDVQAFVDGVENHGWLVKDRHEDKEGEYRTEWVARDSGEAVCGANSAPRLLVTTDTGEVMSINEPEADVSLDQNSPNKNSGAEPRLLAVSRTPESNWRFLVRFDLAAIPAGATIVQAELQLCLDNISGDQSRRVYEAHRVTMPWVEDEVTTNQASQGVPWGFGDFGFTIPHAHINKDVLGNDPDQFRAWDVTTDVQAFLDGVENYGWLVKDRHEDKEGEYRTEWVAKESGAPVCEVNSAPRLLVETDTGDVMSIDEPEADAALDQNSPNKNSGATPDLLAVSRGIPPESNWRFLVRFDLAAIPAEATIVQAELQLCLDKISGDKSRRVYEAHRVTTAWVEDEVTASRAANGAPWDFGFE
jgi:hypothetical protein